MTIPRPGDAVADSMHWIAAPAHFHIFGDCRARIDRLAADGAPERVCEGGIVAGGTLFSAG